MIHIYTGDGKGKTTAALGLALRACGRGKRVVWTSFLKDMSSGEFISPPFEVIRGEPVEGFWKDLSNERRAQIKDEHSRRLREAFAKKADLLVLDEAVTAVALGAVDEDELLELARAFGGELVLTGRGAHGRLLDIADYISEIKCVRHPFDRGVPAREGIEY